ncbi:hypothetical protein EG328_007349 [Venturia inaequalis]|uniref:LCCL domain-containing protein n=1 Tax=Venturia inaequalis TaxID=5025 RepID=A0A8H3YSM2_VENIN|nr:hypothetical protein EG328_007349 [Venturia inaequalis]
MPPRQRDDFIDEPYRDDPVAARSPDALSEQDTVGQDDALSFLGMGNDPAGDEETDASDLTTYQQKHSLLRHLPPKLRKSCMTTLKWLAGPQPPRIWKIKPYFEDVQTYHLQMLEHYFPKKAHKVWLLIAFYFVWLFVFSMVLWKSAFAGDIAGYGKPAVLNCKTTLWRKGNKCGLNGDLCRPFDSTAYAFRCPASCSRTIIYDDYVVGNQTENYRSLVIGGPPEAVDDSVEKSIYRGDSYICGAAVHAGYISDEHGGCGVIRLIGEQSSFPASKRHRISSIGFNSYFPLSFEFVPGKAEKCADLRWPLLGLSVTFSSILSLFVTSPAIFTSSLFTGLFSHVALVSDPPPKPNYYSLISVAFGRFLPAAFCIAVMYMVAIRKTLSGLRAQYEKTILWLGACWVGCLNNYTFDKIPIQRLTPHDLKQPGAIPALITVVLCIFFIAVGQAWGLRTEGLFFKYLAIYGTFVICLLLLVAVPELHLRIHHYILALLLLPGTCMQNRPSLLYQGLLFGLFINGIARWGFDPIIQTTASLRGDAPRGTLLPSLLPPIIHNNIHQVNMAPNITFEWEQPAAGLGYDGISILVNDVERYKGYQDVDESAMKSFTWVRLRTDVPEYFRFAFLKGRAPGDYTKGGTWDVDGGWKHMQPGHTT